MIYANILVQVLDITQVCYILVKLHVGQVLLKHRQITVERKPNHNGYWAIKKSGQSIIQLQVILETDQVDQTSVFAT
jgi:hypothetical protein